MNLLSWIMTITVLGVSLALAFAMEGKRDKENIEDENN